MGEQLGRLTSGQIETLLNVPPGFDFTKIPTDLNNLDFDSAVMVLDNFDPADLPILPTDEDYYYDDEDYHNTVETARKLRHIPFLPSREFFSRSATKLKLHRRRPSRLQ